MISKVKFTNAVVSFLLSMIDFKSKLNDVHCTCPGHSLDKVRNISQMIHDVFQITKNCKIPSKIFRFIKIQLSKLGLKVTQFLVKYKPVIITSLGLNLEVS